MTLTMTKRTMLVTAVALLALGLSLLALPRPAHASTTFTVNQITDVSDEDLADNLCDINSTVSGNQCTLRAAIQEANDTPGADTILFNLFGTGVMTIHVGSTTPNLGGLPQITEAVTIDGYSQYGASENTLEKGTNARPMIELDGSALNGQIAMGLNIDAPNVVIKGLVINRFPYDGILLNSSAASCKVQGNFIGTDPSGNQDLGNTGAGVLIASTAGHDTVGGASPASRNLISGNDSSGVAIDDDSSTNEVSGNLIGTKEDGKSPLGNSFSGVSIASSNNVVGRAAPGYANTIAFNGFNGIGLEYNQSSSSGVPVSNSLLSNSIFSNKDLGIDLGYDGITPNDKKDPDTQENNLQNKPAVVSAVTTSGKTTIKGKLNSTPNKTYTIQFFSNRKGNEGKKLIGQKKRLTTDASGNVTFTFSPRKAVAVGNTITATATKNSTGDTSEFSAPRKVVRP